MTDKIVTAIEVRARADAASREVAKLATAYQKHQNSIRGLSDSARQMGTSFSAAGRAMSAFRSTLTLLGFGTLGFQLRNAAQGALDFERAMVNVQKTTGIAGTELEGLAADLEALGVQLGTNATELARFAGLAGQLGIQGAAALLKFTDVITQLQRATNLVGEEAATQLARVLQLTNSDVVKDIEAIGSVIVKLGNNMATTERAFVAIAERIAPVMRVFESSAEDVVSYAAALDSVGVEGQAASTALLRLFGAMEDAARNVKENRRELELFAEVMGTTAESAKALIDTDVQLAGAKFLGGLGAVSNKTDVLSDLVTPALRSQRPLLALASPLLETSLTMGREERIDPRELARETRAQLTSQPGRLDIASESLSQSFRDIGRVINRLAIPAIETFAGWMRTLAREPNAMTFTRKQQVLDLIHGNPSDAAKQIRENIDDWENMHPGEKSSAFRVAKALGKTGDRGTLHRTEVVGYDLNSEASKFRLVPENEVSESGVVGHTEDGVPILGPVGPAYGLQMLRELDQLGLSRGVRRKDDRVNALLEALREERRSGPVDSGQPGGKYIDLNKKSVVQTTTEQVEAFFDGLESMTSDQILQEGNRLLTLDMLTSSQRNQIMKAKEAAVWSRSAFRGGVNQTLGDIGLATTGPLGYADGALQTYREGAGDILLRQGRVKEYYAGARAVLNQARLTAPDGGQYDRAGEVMAALEAEWQRNGARQNQGALEQPRYMTDRGLERRPAWAKGLQAGDPMYDVIAGREEALRLTLEAEREEEERHQELVKKLTEKHHQELIELEKKKALKELDIAKRNYDAMKKSWMSLSSTIHRGIAGMMLDVSSFKDMMKSLALQTANNILAQSVTKPISGLIGKGVDAFAEGVEEHSGSLLGEKWKWSIKPKVPAILQPKKRDSIEELMMEEGYFGAQDLIETRPTEVVKTVEELAKERGSRDFLEKATTHTLPNGQQIVVSMNADSVEIDSTTTNVNDGTLATGTTGGPAGSGIDPASLMAAAGGKNGDKIARGFNLMSQFANIGSGEGAGGTTAKRPGPLDFIVNAGLSLLGLAQGGNVREAGLAIVGERGPEILELPKSAKVTPLDPMDRMGGNRPINVNLTVNGVQDPAVFDRVIEERMPMINAAVKGELADSVGDNSDFSAAFE